MDRNELLNLYGGEELHEIKLENSVPYESQNKIIVWARPIVENRGGYFNQHHFTDKVNLFTFTLPEGKLPKRISAYIHKQHEIKLTKDESKRLTEMCAEIGRVCSHNHETFLVHVGRRCFWLENSFGDRGSCWFDNKRYHINQMHESPDFAAFTVYKERGGMEVQFEPGLAHPTLPENVGGVGRMWLWFDHVKPNYLAAVSPYGLPDEKMIKILSSMMPEYQYVYGSSVKYPYVPGYQKGLYDNGGYMVWPINEPRLETVKPLFPNAKEEK